MLSFLLEIVIIALAYTLNNPFISLGIFMISLIINIAQRSFFDTLGCMVTYADFKSLKFKQRIKYVRTRIIAYALNPINIIFLAILSYVLNKKFSYFYIWTENLFLLFFYLYCGVLVIVTAVEIAVNIYIYRE